MAHLLHIHDLVKEFPNPEGGTVRIVDVPEFALAAGHQVALQGSSGTGKTTFLHLIAGILRPDRGSIHFDGEDMASMPEGTRDLRRGTKMGYVFQTFNLLQGFTALENVELAMELAGHRDPSAARGLLERVGLGGRLNYRPRQLSVGQQQRVAVARALANKPRLVLADEPTGNLDAHHAGEALALLREICHEQGASLLLVSHDREILAAFDDVRSLAEINRAAALAPASAEVIP